MSHPLLLFPDALAKSWIGSGAVRTQTNAQVGCRRCRWWFSQLHHDAGPTACSQSQPFTAQLEGGNLKWIVISSPESAPDLCTSKPILLKEDKKVCLMTGVHHFQIICYKTHDSSLTHRVHKASTARSILSVPQGTPI